MKEERKPDLDSPDEAAIEQHVDEMLALDPPKANKIVVKDHNEVAAPESEPTSAPEIVSKKSAKKIAITHDESPAKAPIDSALIESVNEQLSEELPGPPPVEPVLSDASLAGEKLAEPLAAVDDGASELPTDKPGDVDPTQEEIDETQKSVGEYADEQDDEPVDDPLDDPVTDKAVDEIVAEESDRLLELEDGAETERDEPERLSIGAKITGLLGLYWRSRTGKILTFLLLFGLVGTAGALPVTRYYALNTAGVRSSASVIVYDSSTLQPLKNVQVKIADQSAQTDATGKATLQKLKLGQTQLAIQKYAYGTVNQQVTIGWGSNPFGRHDLTPVGNQYTIKVTDYLSGQGIAKVQAVAGQADAQSDDKGVIKLTFDHMDATKVAVAVTADGYRAEHFTLDLAATNKPTELKLVPSNKSVYISKRTGTYDVYSKYVDGTDEQKILAGTGNEQDSIVIIASDDGKQAALVSTRDNQRNGDGFLLSTLTMIDLTTNTTKTVTHSEQVYIVGWVGTRLIYVQTAAGTSAANPNRQRLMAYDYRTADNHQLASTNYFNDVMIVAGKIYFAPSSTYQAPGVAINFFSINPDGSNKQTVLAQETWSVYRTGHDEIVLSLPNQQWYSYKFVGTPSKLSGPPGSLASRVYVDSPDGLHSLWVDLRDGKGVLLVYDTIKKSDSTLQSQSGLTTPVRWLNNSSVVFRVKNDQETADYAMSINGGTPHKIADVTNTGGIDKWYYY